MEYADSAPVRWLWRGLLRLPPRVGRGVAAAFTRVQSLTRRGYWKTTHRVSRRLAGANPRLAKVPSRWQGVVAARRAGLRLVLDLRDNLQAVVFFAGRYEPAVRAVLRRELRAGDVVVDVGAHVGVHALAAARWLRGRGGGRVVAFEPAPDSAARLATAAAANDLDVEVVACALGGERAEAELRGDPRYDPADAGVRSRYGEGEVVARVPVRPFDDWAAETGLDRLDVVKIDVEGAEAEVLAGMAGSLRRLRPRVVLVEVKQRERTGVAAEGLRELLAGCGYASTGRNLDHNELFRPV